MEFVSVINGVLQRQGSCDSSRIEGFFTGFKALNELIPPNGLSSGAIHEVLSQRGGRSFALLVAAAALKDLRAKTVVWSDSKRELYPPALSTSLSASRLYMLQIGNAKDELWALSECLRCKGIGAVVASPQRLSRIEARKLQLAAERGGGVGIILRSERDVSAPYAAATRWLVQPARGDESVRRWNVQLIHGHGGQIGKSVLLEIPRDSFNLDYVRAIDPLANRPTAAQVTRASA